MTPQEINRIECAIRHIKSAVDIDPWAMELAVEALEKQMPSAQPESIRTFVELVVRYQDPELCTYKEYKGKPYYSIKYIENGETYVGYGTYNPGVLSQYLKEYFMPSAQPDRKKGQWIKTYRNGFGNLIGYCNQCGRSASVDNYCPNCGANMRGDEA